MLQQVMFAVDRALCVLVSLW